jgi:DNA mismatch endonuclease (patch repair protein)
MSQLRTTGTGPELALRRELHRRGLRYRVNVRGLPGSPDIVLTRARIAVQVDGCFWHGCPDHAVAPRSNAAWWRDKLALNRSRDARNDEALRAGGWLVLRVWEHDDASAAADLIENAWRSRTGRPDRQGAHVEHNSLTGQA